MDNLISNIYIACYIQSGTTDETFFKATVNGSVELYYDNDLHFATTSLGCKTNGDLSFRGDGDVEQILFDASDASLKFTDNKTAKFGTGDDLQIYHDGSNSRIKNTTGSLWLQSDTGIHFTDADVNESMAAFYDNGAVELYYDGSKKFETTSSGATVSGSLNLGSGDLILTGNVDLEDTTGAGNNRIKLGAGDDLQLYHDGSNSSIVDFGTGKLLISGNDAIFFQSTGTGDYFAKFISDGAVELYHDNSKKFETLTNGVRAQGGILFGSDTATANALNDYEEGDWTPSFSSGGWSSLTVNTAKYVKIGAQVFVQCYVSNFQGSSSGNVLQLGGLPFNSISNGYVAGSVDIGEGSIKGAYIRVEANSSTIGFYYPSENVSNSRITLKGNQIGNDYIILGITYFTNS